MIEVTSNICVMFPVDADDEDEDGIKHKLVVRIPRSSFRRKYSSTAENRPVLSASDSVVLRCSVLRMMEGFFRLYIWFQ
jgi:hypothetical protein